QIRVFETLGFDSHELLDVRDFPWCPEGASRIDRRLLDVAAARRDATLAMVLTTSADEEVVIDALKITGRAHGRALARAARRSVDDPIKATQRVAERYHDLQQWLNDARAHGDEELDRLARVIERRAIRA